jgi:hypothetical protein
MRGEAVPFPNAIFEESFNVEGVIQGVQKAVSHFTK